MAFPDQHPDQELLELRKRRELAQRVHAAVDLLNIAVKNAHAERLRVELKVSRRHDLVQWPRVEASVSAPIEPISSDDMGGST